METFETFINQQKIRVRVKIKSLAGEDEGPCSFYLDGNDLASGYNATIDKSSILNPSVLKIRTNLALSREQNESPDRLKFIKSTKIEYRLSDNDTRKTYDSNFRDNEGEFYYDEGNTFFIKKEIEINLLDDFRTNHNTYVRSLKIMKK